MTSQMKRKHSHKRSSSLFQSPQTSNEQEKVTLPCEIAASETLQLIKASEQINQFQIIVDSFNEESPKQTDQDALDQIDPKSSKRSSRQAIFSEYFQIQQVHSLKRQDSARSTLVQDELLWEELHSEPRSNGRLRYHRNNQERVFTISCQKMNLIPGGSKASFDGICCNV